MSLVLPLVSLVGAADLLQSSLLLVLPLLSAAVWWLVAWLPRLVPRAGDSAAVPV